MYPNNWVLRIFVIVIEPGLRLRVWSWAVWAGLWVVEPVKEEFGGYRCWRFQVWMSRASEARGKQQDGQP